jgi:hypothetical protein
MINPAGSVFENIIRSDLPHDVGCTTHEARALSWKNLGKKITFYIPGMFYCDGVRGKYPGISITGSQCSLSCDHCGALILETMIPAQDPRELVRKCIQLERKGNHGVLLSGGCNTQGKLPWHKFVSAIAEIKRRPVFSSPSTAVSSVTRKPWPSREPEWTRPLSTSSEAMRPTETSTTFPLA